MSDDDGWLWHRGHNKAYRPVRTDEDRVVLVTAWHPEELSSARETGALVPIEEVGLDRTETAFDLLDSFRLPDGDELGALLEGGGRTGGEGPDTDAGTDAGADTDTDGERR